MSELGPREQVVLANERTYLAWLRTALALVAGAVAVQAPAIDIDTRVKTVASLWLLGCAGLAIGLAVWRWLAVERAVKAGRPLPGFRGPAVFAVALGVLVVGVAVGVLVVAAR